MQQNDAEAQNPIAAICRMLNGSNPYNADNVEFLSEMSIKLLAPAALARFVL